MIQRICSTVFFVTLLATPFNTQALYTQVRDIMGIVEDGTPRIFASQVSLHVEDAGKASIRFGGKTKGETMEDVELDMHIRLNAEMDGSAVDATVQLLIVDQVLYARVKEFSIEDSLYSAMFNPPRDWVAVPLEENEELFGETGDINAIDEDVLKEIIYDIVDAIYDMQYSTNGTGGYEYLLKLREDFIRRGLQTFLESAEKHNATAHGMPAEWIEGAEEALSDPELWSIQRDVNKMMRFNWRVKTDANDVFLRSIQFLGLRSAEEGFHLTMKGLAEPTDAFAVLTPQRSISIEEWLEKVQ